MNNIYPFQCQTQIILKIDSESENLYSQVKEIAEQYLRDENRLINIRQYLEVIRDTKFELNDEDVIKVINIVLTSRNYPYFDKIFHYIYIKKYIFDMYFCFSLGNSK